MKEQSEYHYAQGLDLSSAANVAAFLSRYVTARKREVVVQHCSQPSKLTDVVHRQNTSAVKPKQCTFCCYDVFTGRDLRVEIAFPGSITT
jgi:hypothetical protein